MLTGPLPPVPELLDSDGLPLSKPAGGVRPFAIGDLEAWLRLAALCAVHECRELGPSLAPLQLGVRIPGGAEGVEHALRSALDAHPGHLLLSLYCKNAFNSVSRQAIFHAAQEQAPSLLPFLTWAYSGPSRVSLHGAPDDSAPILSTSSVEQGDPLGPLLFALTLHGPLTRTAASHPDTQIIAYFDDINIVGPAAAAAPAFDSLAAVARTVGLTPVLSKSAAYSPEQDMAAAAAAELGLCSACCKAGQARLEHRRQNMVA
jgi:hypothetical protein